MRRSVQLAALALTGAFASGAASAASVPETFPLGRSAASGAVCEAIRDYQDPVAQGAGAKAWRVRCRGYSSTLGRLYQLPAARADAWQAALAERAKCEAAGGAGPRACRIGDGGAPYVVFSATHGRTLTVAEGLAPLADVLETGLKVTGGAKPPAMTAIQTSAAQAEIAADFPDMQGLAAAEAAAAADPERLRARGYVQNNEWRFDEAENAFRALVNAGETRNTPVALRADALINLAMNVSNSGRFAEADAYFGEAEGLIPREDLVLRARSQTYRALHERNRGNFQAAITAARAAIRLRGGGAAALGQPTATPIRSEVGLVIDPSLARRLNTPSPAQGQLEPPRVSAEDQLAVQDAQALQIIGTSQASLGDFAAARASLLRSREMLVRAAALGRITAWLRARVEADLAGLDLRQGRSAEAVRGYAGALGILRTRHAGSSAEGALLLELGSAQAAAGREAEALESFDRAIGVFREQRGGLGGSADAAAPYFDLLLRALTREPGNAALAARFFDASQTVVSSATAETVNRLAARVASGDGAVAGLARAFEDSRRRLRATESTIATLQADGAYQGEARAELEQQLGDRKSEADALEAQLLAANPRYNQLVAPGATAAEVQQALRAGEAYLKVLPLAGRSYGVLVTREAVKPYAIPLTRTELQAAVNRLREPLEPTETLIPFDVGASAELFSKLMGPVRSEVLAARHLIYEPGGPLVALPVGLLATQAPVAVAGREPDYTKVAWLGARADTSLVVSGASFLQSRAFAPSRAAQPYLGFGDPALARPGAGTRAYNLARSFGRRSANLEQVCGQTRSALLNIESLPETAQEVRAVGASLGAPANVVTGEAFNDEAVRARSDLSQYKVLYFATHGLLPKPDSCLPEPALVTSLGPGESDALLDTSEILELSLDADLVVLAACDTGGAGAGADRTGLTGAGEALGGLTRAMIYAGSRAMVVSHWSVDSESVVRLMTGVFASGEASLAGALRRSQVALQADPDTAHPYFWAPFTLVGDGARPLPGRAQVAQR